MDLDTSWIDEFNQEEKKYQEFYKQEIAGLNLGGLPVWFQKLIISLGKAGSKQIAKIAYFILNCC